MNILRGDKDSHLLLPLETEQDRPSGVASHHLAWRLGRSSAVAKTIWKSNSLEPQLTEGTHLGLPLGPAELIAWLGGLEGGSRRLACSGAFYKYSSFPLVHTKRCRLRIDASVVR